MDKGSRKGWAVKLIANAVGGTITFVVFMIFLITKFNQVWPILIFLPIVVIGFLKYECIIEILPNNYVQMR